MYIVLEKQRLQRTKYKRDAFDILLDLDTVKDMEIYRDELVCELYGSDQTLFDEAMEEAEKMLWKHKYNFHRYSLQIFDEIKRYHEIRSSVYDYNI